MKKIILQIFVTALAIAPFGQELQHDVVAINVEVPTRVFKGNTFIDNLTMEDFEIYEDGVLQKIEAVYLIKKTNIEREETDKEKKEKTHKFIPELSRNFLLLFEMIEYLPKTGEALDYFFKDVIMPGDSIMVITPAKSYRFNQKALEVASKQEIANRLKEKLRADVMIGNMEYRNLIRELEDSLNSDEDPLGNKRMMYPILLDKLNNLRYIDHKKLMDFAGLLKNMEGQKYIFLFYQKEVIPVPITLKKDESFNLNLDLIKPITLDIEKVKQAFADSSISINFIFITKKLMLGLDERKMNPGEMQMQDRFADDMFATFKEMAQATGGLTESSANVASSFKKAVDASESYYLLYYAPKDYKADGKFRNIKVKVKNKNYRITHRVGYTAN